MAYNPNKLVANVGGNTVGATANISDGTFLIAGGNNITLSQNANSLTLSAPNQSNQSVGLYALGNTTQSSSTTLDARSLSFNGLGALTAGYSNGSIQLSVPVQTVESQSIGMSNLGNTSGTTGVASGGQVRMVFAGGNNITLSQSLNGASGTITISAGAGGGGGGGYTAGLSNIGNTSGDTGAVTDRLILAGGNNITLSGSKNGESMTVTISAQNLFSGGVSDIGNTSNHSGVVSGQMVLAGGNNITLSGSTDADSATYTISGQNPGAQNMEFWQNMGVNGSATDAMAQTATSNGEIRIFQLDIGNNIFAGNMTVNTVLLDMTCNRTATIGNFTWRLSMGIYTLAGSVLHLLYKASTALSSSQTGGPAMNISSIIHGQRYLTFNGSTQFSTVHSTAFTGNAAQLTMSQGLYYMGIGVRSSSNSFSASYYGAILGESGQRSGTMGTSVATSTHMGRFPWMGIFSATSASLPNTVLNNMINKTGNDAIFIPHIVFNNLQGATTF